MMSNINLPRKLPVLWSNKTQELSWQYWKDYCQYLKEYLEYILVHVLWDRDLHAGGLWGAPEK